MYNEDGTEAMDWDKEVDNPYRTQTLTSCKKDFESRSTFEDDM